MAQDPQLTPPSMAGPPPPSQTAETLLDWALDAGINAVMGIHSITHGAALEILSVSIKRRTIALETAMRARANLDTEENTNV